MNPLIPRQIIYTSINRSIMGLDKIKDKILEDEPFYAYLKSEVVPTKPEGGCTLLYFIHNDLEISNKFYKEILATLRKYTIKEDH